MPDDSLTYRVHNHGFVLTSDWPFFTEEGTFTVPKGFVTDLASIPRALWWLPGFACHELGVHGPVLHDWAYRLSGHVAPGIKLIRKRADKLFRTLMRGDGVGRIRASLAYWMVRLFGWLAWKKLPTRGFDLLEV